MPKAGFAFLRLSSGIAWARDGEHLMRLMFDHRGEEFRGRLSYSVTASQSVNDATFDGVACYAGLYDDKGNDTGLRIPPLFFIRKSAENYRPAVQLRNDIPDLDTQVAKWQDALDHAVKQLQKGTTSFDWWSVIAAQDGRGVFHRLESLTHVLGMKLQPVARPFLRSLTRGVTLLPPIEFAGWQGTYPIVVTGADMGLSFEDASATAMQRLSRLCSLLSVAWGACWDVAIPPTSERLNVDSVSDVQKVELERDEDWYDDPVNVPGWLERANELCNEDPRLSSLLLTHHHALNLEIRFPSFGLLGYVAVIETVGQESVTLKRCPDCGAMKGAGERFRAGLREALPEEEARQLSQVYGKRSKTAHEGVLHAGEWLAQEPLANAFDPKAPGWFRATDVDRMRNVSHQLVLRRLTEQVSLSGDAADLVE